MTSAAHLEPGPALRTLHHDQGGQQPTRHTLISLRSSLIVPSGQNAQLTPTLGTELPLQSNGTPGLISPDLNNFAPRIGLSYQLSDKLVLRTGYGIFYGGQENGPFSNPSPGFNPPFLSSQSYNAPCGAPTAKLRMIARSRREQSADCRLTCSQGFSYTYALVATRTRRTLFARSAPGHALHAAVAPWVSSTNCLPRPFSKFPTAARAD